MAGRTSPKIILPAVGAACLVAALSDTGAINGARDAQPEDNSPMLSQAELDNLPSDGGPEYNRLVFEKSPYLLQHARNPVDWYAWGNEAFERARREDKPVFLSIGYSTCHWCHVMERESFEDAEVAELMNEVFVCIKVDREERPDIDNVYMNVAQAMTGRGGWPLTIVMAPDKRPFFAATYIPKEDAFGRMGMMSLVPRIQDLWNERRDEILKSADQVTSFLRDAPARGDGRRLGLEDLRSAYKELAGRFDEAHGGFGDAPKFPTPHNLLFLLRYWKRTGEARALEMVEKTLTAMRLGGIFDHVGLGFHRYSTDRVWLLPHFEKMLYDQAMLAMAYVEAYQATGRSEFGATARSVFQYVLGEMTSPEGGFYSAEDADSEGEEGKYYVWTSRELIEVLGPDDGSLAARVFNVEKDGNFKHEAGGSSKGANIPHLKKPLCEIAKELGTDYEKLRERIEAARVKLLETRRRRVPPLKDDKILTDWNGLMIAALAKGAQVLGEARYASAASSAAEFLLSKMTDEDGKLFHRYRGGEAAVAAFLDDYAFLVWGLTDLYEATFDVRYLQAALDLARRMKAGFWDDEAGGFYFYAEDSEELIVRRKELYDGAIPSGNSAAALGLLRLGRMTGDTSLEEDARRTMGIFSRDVGRTASGYTQMMVALDFGVGPSFEVVIAGKGKARDTERMLGALRRMFIPGKVVLFRPTDVSKPPITSIAEYTETQTAIDGKATAYVCENFACKAPTTDPTEMLRLLGAK